MISRRIRRIGGAAGHRYNTGMPHLRTPRSYGEDRTTGSPEDRRRIGCHAEREAIRDGNIHIRTEDPYLDQLPELIHAESIAGFLAYQEYHRDERREGSHPLRGACASRSHHRYPGSRGRDHGFAQELELSTSRFPLPGLCHRGAKHPRRPLQLWKLAFYAGLVLMSLSVCSQQGAGGKRIP